MTSHPATNTARKTPTSQATRAMVTVMGVSTSTTSTRSTTSARNRDPSEHRECEHRDEDPRDSYYHDAPPAPPSNQTNETYARAEPSPYMEDASERLMEEQRDEEHEEHRRPHIAEEEEKNDSGPYETCHPGYGGYASYGYGCQPCPENHYSAVGKCAVCRKCPANSAYTRSASAECVCLPGHGGSDCAPCTEGTYSPGGSFAVCIPCGALLTSPKGSTSVSQCECIGGFGTTAQNLYQCSPCKIGTFNPNPLDPAVRAQRARMSSRDGDHDHHDGGDHHGNGNGGGGDPTTIMPPRDLVTCPDSCLTSEATVWLPAPPVPVDDIFPQEFGIPTVILALGILFNDSVPCAPLQTIKVVSDPSAGSVSLKRTEASRTILRCQASASTTSSHTRSLAPGPTVDCLPARPAGNRSSRQCRKAACGMLQEASSGCQLC